MKEEADLLELPPSREMFMSSLPKSEQWQKAFDWYNKYINKGRPYELNCKGCYIKVYRALNEVKQLNQQNG